MKIGKQETFWLVLAGKMLIFQDVLQIFWSAEKIEDREMSEKTTL